MGAQFIGNFGDALDWLRQGERVQRTGWNGKGMWLLLVAGAGADSDTVDYVVRDDTSEQQTDGLRLLPWIGMKTAVGGFVPWLASQTDMLAKDWQQV